jgi:hypothetical protein
VLQTAETQELDPESGQRAEIALMRGPLVASTAYERFFAATRLRLPVRARLSAPPGAVRLDDVLAHCSLARNNDQPAGQTPLPTVKNKPLIEKETVTNQCAPAC